MTAQILRIRDYEPRRRERGTQWPPGSKAPTVVLPVIVVRAVRPAEELDQVPSCWPNPGSRT